MHFFVFPVACFSVEGACETELVRLELWHWAVGGTSVMGKSFISDNMLFVVFIGQLWEAQNSTVCSVSCRNRHCQSAVRIRS